MKTERGSRLPRNYDGGKAGPGVYQHLITLMPRHDLYIEPFLGAGAVLRHKLPAAASIGIERDGKVLSAWNGDEVPNLTLIEGDAIAWLKFKAAEHSGTASSPMAMPPGTLIYCDPPYVMSSRSCKQRIYRHELTDADHIALLAILRALPCFVMISGYNNPLYNQALADWRTYTFQTTNRRGKKVTEWVWMNFPAPTVLHDTRFLGRNFRERERIKRRQHRWRAKLAVMPDLERLALMAALEELLKSPKMAMPAEP